MYKLWVITISLPPAMISYSSTREREQTSWMNVATSGSVTHTPDLSF